MFCELHRDGHTCGGWRPLARELAAGLAAERALAKVTRSLDAITLAFPGASLDYLPGSAVLLEPGVELARTLLNDRARHLGIPDAEVAPTFLELLRDSPLAPRGAALTLSGPAGTTSARVGLHRDLDAAGELALALRFAGVR